MVKLTKKDTWDRVKYVPQKIRGIVDLFRPFTLLAPLVGGFSGALIAAKTYGFDLLLLCHGVGTLLLVTAASNALNQVADADIDAVNKPYRPIPAGIVAKDEARTIAYFLYIFAIFRACFLNTSFAVLILAVVLLTITYSLEPLRLKKRVWLSNIGIATCRGLLGFVAAWCIFGEALDPTPWLLGTVLMVYVLGASVTKDFTDMRGDRMYNVKTLPLVYGKKKAARVAGVFFVLPFGLIFGMANTGFLLPRTLWLTPLAFWGVYAAHLLMKHATAEDAIFENTRAWKHMYFMLFALQIGFCVIYTCQ
jgi:chlorophyll synthase